MGRIYAGDGNSFVWQWQPKGQIVLDSYPDGVFVRYSNCDTVEAPVVQTRRDGDKLIADIPPELMQVDKDITVYVCNEDGIIHCHFLSVISSPKPSSYIYEPVEVLRYESLAERIRVIEEWISKGGGIQEETDPTVPDWAKQPQKPAYTAQEVGAMPAGTKIPGKTSELTNDAGFVDKAVSDLINYYTKEQMQELIAAIPRFRVTVVQQLPAAGEELVLYLVPFATAEGQYLEYIWVDGRWEVIGSQRVDLTGYAKEDWVEDYVSTRLEGDSGQKVDLNQGAENSGKFLGIDDAGIVTPMDVNKMTQSEELTFAYTKSYPDGTTFEYEKRDKPYGYWVFEPSSIRGGILSVDWDTTRLTSFDIILYLFKDGQPYKYIQQNIPGGTNVPLAGDEPPIIWIEPGKGSGFCKATAPFNVKIPNDCTVMICMRSTYNVYPDGNDFSNGNFPSYASEFFTVKVDKTISFDPSIKLDKNQGADNASRYLVTDESGNIVCGDRLPGNVDLRATWDTVIHRGWVSGAPENTLPAFFLAKENGYYWVECDVRMSADGVPVLAHDSTITGTNASGASVTLTVADTTLADLQAVTLATHSRFGAVKTNTLAELLEMARVLGMKVLIDIKVSGQAAMEAIAKTVLRYGMGSNVVYMPIGADNANFIKSIDKNANFDFVRFGTSPTADDDFTAYAALLSGGNRVNFDVQADTWGFAEADIDAINSAGIGLAAWNVHSENVVKCLDAGAVRLTKHNNFDSVDLDAVYLATKTYW